MLAALRDPTSGARIVETRWSALGRTDLVAFADESGRAIFVDGGAGTTMLALDAEYPPIERFQRDTAYLPFLAGPGGNVLIVGAGGGQDVVMALKAGWSPVTAIEVNPAAVDMVLRHADYNGDIYRRPGVEVVVDEARSSIRRSSQTFDMVYLSLVFTQASESLAYVLAESHVYTVEAFRDYLDVLEPGGWLALVLHDDASLSKALATALRVLRERGTTAADLARQVAVVRPPAQAGADPRAIVRPLLVIRRDPMTQAEAERLVEQMTDLELDPVYVPFTNESGLVADLVTVPQAVDVSPDGRVLFVANAKDQTLSAISLKTGHLLAQPRVGALPIAVAAIPRRPAV